jgi:hypothetical protein
VLCVAVIFTADLKEKARHGRDVVGIILSSGLSLRDILKRLRRHRRIADGVGDRGVAGIVLESPRREELVDLGLCPMLADAAAAEVRMKWYDGAWTPGAAASRRNIAG